VRLVEGLIDPPELDDGEMLKALAEADILAKHSDEAAAIWAVRRDILLGTRFASTP
jgi:hypothetical protein